MRLYERVYVRGMRSPAALHDSRLSTTLDTHVSARTTASAGDCTRPRVLGYLFEPAQTVSIICVYIDVARELHIVDTYL